MEKNKLSDRERSILPLRFESQGSDELFLLGGASSTGNKPLLLTLAKRHCEAPVIMSHCQTCGKPIEEVFNIPWLGKFYRCEDGHPEVRDTEGTRAPLDREVVARIRDCQWFAEKFVRKKKQGAGVVESAPAP